MTFAPRSSSSGSSSCPWRSSPTCSSQRRRSRGTRSASRTSTCSPTSSRAAGLAPAHPAAALRRRDQRPRHRAGPAVDGDRRPARGGDDHPHDRRRPRCGRPTSSRPDGRRPGGRRAFVDQLPERSGSGSCRSRRRPGSSSADDRSGGDPQRASTTSGRTAARRWATRSRCRWRLPASTRIRFGAHPRPRRVARPGAGCPRRRRHASPDPSASPADGEPPLVATVLLSDGANSTGDAPSRRRPPIARPRPASRSTRSPSAPPMAPSRSRTTCSARWRRSPSRRTPRRSPKSPRRPAAGRSTRRRPRTCPRSTRTSARASATRRRSRR